MRLPKKKKTMGFSKSVDVFRNALHAYYPATSSWKCDLPSEKEIALLKKNCEQSIPIEETVK